MPSAAAHFALAYTIEDALGFRNNAFAYGCILPDFIASKAPKSAEIPFSGSKQGISYSGKIFVSDPHYRKPSTYCLVPDLDRFWRESELMGNVKLGYYAHLIEDLLFLEEFCPGQGLDDLSFFTADKVYEEYTRLNPRVMEEFYIDLERVNRVLKQEFFYIGVDKKRYQRNAAWINNPEVDQPWPQYIDPEDFYAFIRYAAEQVMSDARFRSLACELHTIR